MDEQRPVYSISAVARMLDVPVPTLRTWEDRYGQVVPARSSNGRRLFNRDQIEQLKFVRARMSEGASAADAHRLLTERMEDGMPLAGHLQRPGQGSRPLILMAEADPWSAEFQEYFLRTEGFDVVSVLGEDAAREAFAASSPAVVIVEILISGGTGLELCRFFRERGNVPVIAVSVLDARDAAVEHGADAFVIKPLEPLQLVSTVRDLLRRSAYLAG